MTRQPVGGIVGLERQEQAQYMWVRARLDGYRTAFHAAGIAWRDVPVYECMLNREDEGGRAAEALLQHTHSRTGLLVLTDRLALGALAAVQRLGLNVPPGYLYRRL